MWRFRLRLPPFPDRQCPAWGVWKMSWYRSRRQALGNVRLRTTQISSRLWYQLLSFRSTKRHFPAVRTLRFVPASPAQQILMVMRTALKWFIRQMNIQMILWTAMPEWSRSPMWATVLIRILLMRIILIQILLIQTKMRIRRQQLLRGQKMIPRQMMRAVRIKHNRSLQSLRARQTISIRLMYQRRIMFLERRSLWQERQWCWWITTKDRCMASQREQRRTLWRRLRQRRRHKLSQTRQNIQSAWATSEAERTASHSVNSISRRIWQRFSLRRILKQLADWHLQRAA